LQNFCKITLFKDWMKQMMNGGEVVVATLLSREIETVFFVPGGTYVTVLEALSRVQNKIRSVATRLESSAMFAAETYSAIKRKPACVFVSRAPGASNAVIGVHTAMQASRPLVLFVANIPRNQKGREAFQEIDYLRMFSPVAKAVFDVNSFDELADVTARALDLSVSGRPGPVVCAIAKDILDGVTGDPTIPPAPAPVILGAEPTATEAAAALIREAKHPIILGGEMIPFEGAIQELQDFAEASGAGVMTAYRQQDIFPNEHPAHFGQLTLNRLPFQTEAWDKCDLIINIGCRLDSATTSDYTLIRDDQKMIMAYPDASIFSQWQADVALGANAKPALVALTKALTGFEPPAARVAWRDDIHAKEVAYAAPGEIEVVGDVDMAQVIATFGEIVPDDAILSADAGTFGRWLHRYYRSNAPFSNFGPISGAMGYGVPGAIGAAVADPDRPVFAWCGDGGFLMTGQEAAAIVQEKLPVTIIVCDNSAWGSILVHQQKRFGDWDFGTRLVSPDFAMLGRGYGMAAFTVTKTSEFAEALRSSMAHNGPALIHIKLDLRDVSPYSGSAR
jgi:acetolactate synthase-1/2/3 large subunit